LGDVMNMAKSAAQLPWSEWSIKTNSTSMDNGAPDAVVEYEVDSVPASWAMI